MILGGILFLIGTVGGVLTSANGLNKPDPWYCNALFFVSLFGIFWFFHSLVGWVLP